MPLKGATIGIKELAELNQLSETYFSKIFTKLRKAGIARSIQGAKGGYELTKSAYQISFWDVVEAIEGSTYLFQCCEIRQNNILVDKDEPVATCPCLIHVVMKQAEDEMRNYLKAKSLGWLHENVTKDFSETKKTAINDWLIKAISR